MSHRHLPILVFLIAILAAGCAHKYSEAQYKQVVDQVSTGKAELAKAHSENENLSKSLAETRKKLDQTSQELRSAVVERQEQMDKTIQCLEDKKILVKQINQANTLSQEKREAQQHMNRDFEYITSLLDAERLSDQLYIVRAQDKIRIVIPQKTLFPTPGSAWLTPKGVKTVKKIAAGLKQLSPNFVEIAGHTDATVSPEAKNTYPTNWHLAHARALSVLMVFSEGRFKKDTMCAISYGDSKPMADPTSEAGKAMNRRVEIIFTP